MKPATEAFLADFANARPELAGLLPAVRACVCEIAGLPETNQILVAGNGGSCADSDHFAGELLKSFLLQRPLEPSMTRALAAFPDGDKIAHTLQRGVRVIPLASFPAFATAFANDCDADFTYAQLVNVLGRPGDLFFAFSTSGNSRNLLYAAQTARARGLKVIGLTGQSGGRLRAFCDILLNAPFEKVWQIQEAHLPLYHLICLCAENELFGPEAPAP